MTIFYENLCENSGFDKALICRAFEFAKNIDTKKYSRLFFEKEPCSVENTGVLYFEEAFFPYEFFSELKKLPLPPETAALYIYTSLLREAFSDFSARIDNTQIFFDTTKRLSAGASEYFEKTGGDGLFDYHFLANHVRGGILRLGEFEYQYGSFEGKKAIFLHLADNSDLSKEKRLFSYALAREYFGVYPIIADSWLLYPENKKMLPKGSRICEFMDDFDIISVSETVDYSEAFHVFGRLSDFSYENLPKSTSLQRAYAERIKNALPVGSGVGVLKY